MQIMAQLLPQYRTFSGIGAWRNEPLIADQASTATEAEYLTKQYQTAYGPTYFVWWERQDDEGAG
jgi:hypothetical protein